MAGQTITGQGLLFGLAAFQNKQISKQNEPNPTWPPLTAPEVLT